MKTIYLGTAGFPDYQPTTPVGLTTPAMLKKAALLFDQLCLYGSEADPRLLEVPEQFKYAMYLSAPDFVDTPHAGSGLREVLDDCTEFGAEVVPIYHSEDDLVRDFPAGKNVSYTAAVNNLAVVSEEDVTWQQIVEFRSDPEALRKYRALRLWLKVAANSDSVQHATDVIASKLDDYEWAIRKHGLKSTVGFVSHLVDLKTVVPAAAGAVAGAALSGPLWAAISAGLILSGKACAWAAERLVDLRDVKRGQHSEIAVLYDAKKKLG